MSNNPFQQAIKIARALRLFAAALVLGCVLGTVANAAAQKTASPKTPDGITPVGNTAFLVGHAFGTQGYTCLPTSDGGTAWNANARPEATWIRAPQSELQARSCDHARSFIVAEEYCTAQESLPFLSQAPERPFRRIRPYQLVTTGDSITT